jgi:hypothetical protein
MLNLQLRNRLASNFNRHPNWLPYRLHSASGRYGLRCGRQRRAEDLHFVVIGVNFMTAEYSGTADAVPGRTSGQKCPGDHRRQQSKVQLLSYR